MKKNLEKALRKMSDDYDKNDKIVNKYIFELDDNDVIDIAQLDIDCQKKIYFLNAIFNLNREKKKSFNKKIVVHLLGAILNDYLSKNSNDFGKDVSIAYDVRTILLKSIDYDLFEPCNVILKDNNVNHTFESVIEIIEYYITNKFEEFRNCEEKKELKVVFKNIIAGNYLTKVNKLTKKIVNNSHEDVKDFLDYFFENGVNYQSVDSSLLHICLKDEKKNKEDVELVIEKLLNLGVDTNIYDRNKNPYLFYEIRYKYFLDEEKYLLDDNGFKKSLERAIKYGYDIYNNDYIFNYLYNNNMMNDKVFEILYNSGANFGYNSVISTFISLDQAFSKPTFNKLKFFTSYAFETKELVKKLEMNNEGLTLETNFFKHIIEVSETIENLLCLFCVYFEKDYETIPDLSSEGSDINQYIYNLIIEDKKNGINTNNEITVSDILKILSKINNTIYTCVDTAIEENTQKILTLPNK